MKFTISRASSCGETRLSPIDGAVQVMKGEDNWEWEIKINTLEELLALCDKAENNLIVSREEIMIYDYYVE